MKIRTIIGFAALVGLSTGMVGLQAQDDYGSIRRHERDPFEQGRHTFRFDTFGDEASGAMR